MKAKYCVVASVFVLISAVSEQAEATLYLGGDVGFSRITNDRKLKGVGLNIYGGYELPFGLIPEVQLAVHRFDFENSGLTMDILPFMVGARFVIDVGSFAPFFGGHLGAARVKFEDDNFGVTSETEFKAALNAGVGADYMFNDLFGVGLALWWWVFRTELIENTKMLTLGANATFRL